MRMGKKKKEHILFDRMLKTKESIPFSIINKKVRQKKADELRWDKGEHKKHDHR